MDYKWLVKAYGILVIASAAPVAAFAGGRIGQLVAGGLLLALATVYFDPLYRTGERWVPTYMEKFPLRTRSRMEERYRNPTRAILALWGVLWMSRAATMPTRILPIGISPIVAATWLLWTLAFLFAWEYTRYRTATVSSTYEEFQLRFSPLGRWITVAFLVASVTTATYVATG